MTIREALETVEATLATVGISKALGEIRDAYMGRPPRGGRG